MFLGEFLCFLLHAIKIIKKRRSKQSKKTILPKAPLFIFAIPAFLDIFVVGFMNVTLTMMNASTQQMLKGGTILITAVMSILFLQRRLNGQHWMSMTIIFIGLYIIGKVQSQEEDPIQRKQSESVVPIELIVLFVGQILDAAQNIVQEKIVVKYKVEALQQVGMEGFWGLIMTPILLFIFTLIPCSHPELCPQGSFDNTYQAF